MRNFVLNGEAVDATVQALFVEYRDDVDNQIYYKDYGYEDYEPDIPEEKLSSVSGLGKGKLTVAGQQYGSNTRYKGYSKQLVLRKYTSEIEYSEEDIHWLQKAPTTKRVLEFKDNIEGAVNALNANVNDDAAKMIYLAHGTTFFTGGDGVALASRVHPIRKPGAGFAGYGSNVFCTNTGAASTHKAFTPDTLVEALQIMDRYVMNNGRQIAPARRLRILVSTELADTVAQTLQSLYGPNTDLGLSKGSAEFQRSRGRTIDYRVVVDQPQAYSTYWAIVDLDRAKRMFFMAWGWKQRLMDESEKRKGLRYNEGSVLFGPIARDWRFGFFSKGDGTAT